MNTMNNIFSRNQISKRSFATLINLIAWTFNLINLASNIQVPFVQSMSLAASSRTSSPQSDPCDLEMRTSIYSSELLASASCPSEGCMTPLFQCPSQNNDCPSDKGECASPKGDCPSPKGDCPQPATPRGECPTPKGDCPTPRHECPTPLNKCTDPPTPPEPCGRTSHKNLGNFG